MCDAVKLIAYYDFLNEKSRGNEEIYQEIITELSIAQSEKGVLFG